MVYDVIIAGAGPVGLFLAGELRLARVSVLVLEPLEDPRSPLKRLPFGMRGLWGPSIEAFYRRGLLDEIAATSEPDGKAGGPPKPGAPSPGQQRGPAGHFAGIQFDHANIESSRWTWRLPGPSAIQLGSDMESLERVLAARATALGAELERGHGVESFQPANDAGSFTRLSGPSTTTSTYIGATLAGPPRPAPVLPTGSQNPLWGFCGFWSLSGSRGLRWDSGRQEVARPSGGAGRWRHGHSRRSAYPSRRRTSRGGRRYLRPPARVRA
jgi:FAD binding domain